MKSSGVEISIAKSVEKLVCGNGKNKLLGLNTSISLKSHSLFSILVT